MEKVLDSFMRDFDSIEDRATKESIIEKFENFYKEQKVRTKRKTNMSKWMILMGLFVLFATYYVRDVKKISFNTIDIIGVAFSVTIIMSCVKELVIELPMENIETITSLDKLQFLKKKLEIEDADKEAEDIDKNIIEDENTTAQN